MRAAAWCVLVLELAACNRLFGIVEIHPVADAAIDAAVVGCPRGFPGPPLVPTGKLPRAIATADFDGDGKPDLVTVNEGTNDLSVLLGRGDGPFGPQDAAPRG